MEVGGRREERGGGGESARPARGGRVFTMAFFAFVDVSTDKSRIEMEVIPLQERLWKLVKRHGTFEVLKMDQTFLRRNHLPSKTRFVQQTFYRCALRQRNTA